MRSMRNSSRCWFGDCTDCVGAEGGFRLVAVFQLKTGNDCCQRKPSLHWFVIAGPLYLSKPSLKAGLGRVTAFIGVEMELSTQSGLLVNWTHGPQADIQHRLTTRARRTICRDCRRCCWLRCSRRIASSRHTERGFCWVWMFLPALLLLVADAVFNLLIASSASRPSPLSSQRVRNVIRSSASPNCLDTPLGGSTSIEDTLRRLWKLSLALRSDGNWLTNSCTNLVVDRQGNAFSDLKRDA